MNPSGEYRALRRELDAQLARRTRGKHVRQEDIDAIKKRLAEIEDGISADPDPVRRELLRMLCIDGMTVMQIAARRGCSRQTVYRILRGTPP